MENIGTGGLHGFNKDMLYRQETFVDPGAGEIIVWIPVLVDGLHDPVRVKRFHSAVTVSINNQPMPVRFEIKNATTLEEAIGQWKDQATVAGQEFIAQVRERQTNRPLALPPGTPQRKLDS